MNDTVSNTYHTGLARLGLHLFRWYYLRFPLDRGKTWLRSRVHPYLMQKKLICKYRDIALYPMDLRTPIYNYMFYRNIHEQEEQLLNRILQPGMTFVDIGANIGTYTVVASAVMGASGNVISFEPELANYTILSETVKLNQCSNVRLVRMALSDEVGEGWLKLSEGPNPGEHALSIDGQSEGTQAIELSTLDRVMQSEGFANCDLIKLDVEGVELKVLKGATNTLSASPHPALIIEVSDENSRTYGSTSADLFDYLKEIGYTSFSYRDNSLVACSHPGTWIHCENFIFLHESDIKGDTLPWAIRRMIV